MKKILKIFFIFIFIIFIFASLNYMFSYLEAKRGLSYLEKNYKTINIDDKKIAYYEEGAGETIIFLHDFMSSAKDFEDISKNLSEKYRVISIDLPGFGFSTKSTDLNYSKKSMGKLINKFTKELNIETFYLVGHSMGGEIAINTYFEDTKKIKKLILINSQGYTKTKFIPNWISDSQFFSRIFLKFGFQSYFLQQSIYKNNLHDKSKYEDSTFLKNYTLTFNIPSKTLQKIDLDDDSSLNKDKISEINIPTLILWGNYDKTLNIEYAKKFNEQIKNSTLVYLDAGHNPMIEKSDYISNLILNFLK
ncbi:alpha/beta hydrolase [Oceanotoga sp. DSM 15011]|uniref:alpha/beta fold hydrolase n=1 Tax=Oceanotoga sp. DSM 15011 TaxID=2984951 RepID=UPI0021F3C98A|nr:alpha/beta hydrolase [Oceanotoga sp. DSM 15011]UYP01158.1 alpha/beta hydrolase [Oceanotoga sp. DSM 15011]